jgi:hypothetical protein
MPSMGSSRLARSQFAGMTTDVTGFIACDPERRGSAGVLAFADLGDEVLDGGEGEVRAVSEDGVTRSGKAHLAEAEASRLVLGSLCGLYQAGHDDRVQVAQRPVHQAAHDGPVPRCAPADEGAVG